MVRRHTVSPHVRVSKRGRVSRVGHYARGSWIPAEGPPIGTEIGIAPPKHPYVQYERGRNTAAFLLQGEIPFQAAAQLHGLRREFVYLVQPAPEDVPMPLSEVIAHENLHQVLMRLEGFPASRGLDRLVNYGTLRRGRVLRGGV